MRRMFFLAIAAAAFAGCSDEREHDPYALTYTHRYDHTAASFDVDASVEYETAVSYRFDRARRFVYLYRESNGRHEQSPIQEATNSGFSHAGARYRFRALAPKRDDCGDYVVYELTKDDERWAHGRLDCESAP